MHDLNQSFISLQIGRGKTNKISRRGSCRAQNALKCFCMKQQAFFSNRMKNVIIVQNIASWPFT